MKYLPAIGCLAILLFGASSVFADPPTPESCPTTTELIDERGGAIILEDEADGEDEGEEQEEKRENDSDE